MREILFRGKRIDNGEWVYGYYVTHRDVDGNILHYISVPTEIWGTGRKYYIVDPSTIGQCTGLTDKNGKKIFEGDIVEYHYEINKGKFKDIIYVVKEESGYWAIQSDYYYGFVLGLRKLNTRVKIIGNIHDNPELLEDKP